MRAGPGVGRTPGEVPAVNRSARRPRGVERVLRRFASIAVVAAAALLAAPASLHAAAAPDAISADGGRYYGPLVNGLRQGHGRLEWPNGAIYEGGFEQGLFSGRGRLQSAAGDVYEGEFVAGMRSGKGREVLRGGGVYDGDFRNDEFDGRGRFEGPDGSVYEGTFARGLFSGRGRNARRGETYEGEFRLGLPSGQGEVVYDGGRKYRGAFEQGHFQGIGRYETPEGVYEGEFVAGDFTGRGTFVRTDGSRHEGAFVKWMANGPGVYTDARGIVYRGNFVNSELVGIAQITVPGGTRYEGEVSAWTPHGRGVMHLPNGDVYTGGFAYGQYHGQGTLVYAKPARDSSREETGEWRNGKLRRAEQREQAQIRAGVETALYRQRSALTQALATLRPRDPGKINLYLLAVAGGGAQEVFRREVEFVREQFDRRFQTRGHSLALINSRTTGPDVPMATVTSIGEALTAIASQMDRERDILFLFVTSHGSKEHELALDQRGMELPGLSAQRLGELLRDSGIRWKVVLISACYSGGFIDPLADERTLVITASRADRTSFGCADTNELTDFGRAYFKEALPQSGSFQDAFNRAESIVARWEAVARKAAGKSGGDDSSLPQMSNPPAIDAYLRRWWPQATEPRNGGAATAPRAGFPPPR